MIKFRTALIAMIIIWLRLKHFVIYFMLCFQAFKQDKNAGTGAATRR
jgi:hypothetical protein